jgi:riboflavin kinase/FMN adenylyltransferase
MRHIQTLAEANLPRPSVVTIGAFDGVHRGHQHLVGQLVAESQRSDLTPVVLTFHPLPKLVLEGFRPGFYLSTPDEKAEILGQLGVELIVTHPFNEEVRHIRAAAFVKSLLEHLKMAELWVGADFAMGYQREGNVGFLHEQANSYGFRLRVVDLMDAGGERVSSSRVRAALAEGNVAEAARLLGRPYRLSGEVVPGAQRGKKLGIPTANLAVLPERAVPQRGVYAGRVTADTISGIPAVANIGIRPTFDGTDTTTIEAHLLDYNGDIYGHTMRLDFIARLRDEHQFINADELVAQIKADIRQSRELLAHASDVSQSK